MSKRLRLFTSSEEYVECLICGKHFNQIHWSHLRSHNISLSDYKKKYNLGVWDCVSRPLRIKKQESAFTTIAKGTTSFSKVRTSYGSKIPKNILPSEVRSKVAKKMWSKKTNKERSKQLQDSANKRWEGTTSEYRRKHLEPANANRTEETIEKIRSKLIGRKIPEDVKRKISEGVKRYHVNKGFR